MEKFERVHKSHENDENEDNLPGQSSAHFIISEARKVARAISSSFYGWRSWIRNEDMPSCLKPSASIPNGLNAFQRVVHISDPHGTDPESDFADNVVKTSKYTAITFLPRNLFEQFHRVAYVYFLLIAILNQIPVLAVFGRTVSVVPLLAVLIVTAIKDAYEDYARHKADNLENNRMCLVLRGDQFERKTWQQIRVGDVLKVVDGETFPSDMVLLSTSDKTGGKSFVETMNLDGETSLKSRTALTQTMAMISDERSFHGGKIECENPNRNIYGFVGSISFSADKTFSLGPQNIVLRGCELRNTEYAIGCVVYAGKETKVQMNSSGAQSKRSRLEHHMNRDTLVLGAILAVLCTIDAVGMGIWISRSNVSNIPYYGASYNFHGAWGEAGLNWFSCLIVFQIMVPISLYISLELMRLGQSYFMTRDLSMYHEETNQFLQVRALNINEDLGQIGYVFSDKTGTLTENKMEFRECCVLGSNFAAVPESLSRVEGHSVSAVQNRELREVSVASSLVAAIEEQGEQEEQFRDFFLTLALCNTVLPFKAEREAEAGEQNGLMADHSAASTAVEYQGESPDEIALVRAAKRYGFELVERNSDSVELSVLGKTEKYDILGIHGFNSVRKRMSAVVKCPNGRLKVLAKGADSAMLALLSRGSAGSQSETDPILKSTMSHVESYARKGLRTLLIASRNLTHSEAETWRDKYNSASLSIHGRAAKLEEAADVAERDLTVLGGTGIEDRLQDGVQDTILALRTAGMRVWVLTGDKQETAVSVAYSCHLLSDAMQQIVINEDSFEGVKQALESAVSAASGSSRSDSDEGFALIVDGTSLSFALDPELSGLLFQATNFCEVVLCTRVAPLQKAGIVSMVKKFTEDLCLAIGDGANDVSMIQIADIGVGMSGQEGRQAVMASDFAVSRFRFLSQLLLVHGSWNYQRLAHMVLYNFYKNAVFVFLLFWFTLFTAFSPQTGLSDWNLIFYSLVYTSVPTIAVGILEQHLSARTLQSLPNLYRAGPAEEAYNFLSFCVMLLDTLWQSVVLFFVPYMCAVNDPRADLWSVGQVWTVSVVIVASLHLAMDVRFWTWVHHCVIWLCVIGSFVVIIILDLVPSIPQSGSLLNSANSMSYWLQVLLITVAALAPRFVAKVVFQTRFPSDIQIAYDGELKGNIGD